MQPTNTANPSQPTADSIDRISKDSPSRQCRIKETPPGAMFHDDDNRDHWPGRRSHRRRWKRDWHIDIHPKRASPPQQPKFFSDALTPKWKEGEEKLVKVPALPGTAFTTYAKFIMTGLMFDKPSDDATTASAPAAAYELKMSSTYRNTVRLYYIAALGSFFT